MSITYNSKTFTDQLLQEGYFPKYDFEVTTDPVTQATRIVKNLIEKPPETPKCIVYFSVVLGILLFPLMLLLICISPRADVDREALEYIFDDDNKQLTVLATKNKMNYIKICKLQPSKEYKYSNILGIKIIHRPLFEGIYVPGDSNSKGGSSGYTKGPYTYKGYLIIYYLAIGNGKRKNRLCHIGTKYYEANGRDIVFDLNNARVYYESLPKEFVDILVKNQLPIMCANNSVEHWFTEKTYFPYMKPPFFKQVHPDEAPKYKCNQYNVQFDNEKNCFYITMDQQTMGYTRALCATQV